MSKKENMIMYFIIIVLVLIAGYMIYSKKSFENFAPPPAKPPAKPLVDSQKLYKAGVDAGWAFIKSQHRNLMSIDRTKWSNAYPLGYLDGLKCGVEYYQYRNDGGYKNPSTIGGQKQFKRSEMTCDINKRDIYDECDKK